MRDDASELDATREKTLWLGQLARAPISSTLLIPVRIRVLHTGSGTRSAACLANFQTNESSCRLEPLGDLACSPIKMRNNLVAVDVATTAVFHSVLLGKHSSFRSAKSRQISNVSGQGKERISHDRINYPPGATEFVNFPRVKYFEESAIVAEEIDIGAGSVLWR